MATNPLIAQGVLNRVIGSITWTNNSSLNVTAPFLGREGIRLALEGEATQYFPTMTGAVASPEPYMMIQLRVMLLKTNGLAVLYKQQMESYTVLGDGIVWPDTTNLPTYPIVNCSITGVNELSFDGLNPDWAVTVRGYYLINSSLWNG